MRGTPKMKKALTRTGSVDWAYVEARRPADLNVSEQAIDTKISSVCGHDVTAHRSRDFPRRRSLSRTKSIPAETKTGDVPSCDRPRACSVPQGPSAKVVYERLTHKNKNFHFEKEHEMVLTVRKTLSDSQSLDRKDKNEAYYASTSSDILRFREPQQRQHKQSTTAKTESGVSSSCPNLVEGKVSTDTHIKSSRSSEGVNHTSSGRTTSIDNSSSVPNTLRVPNIFVTSFTHSTDGRACPLPRSLSISSPPNEGGRMNFHETMPVLSAGIDARYNYRHSAPELSGSHRSPTRTYWERIRETIKPTLKKSLSDTPANFTKEILKDMQAESMAKPSRSLGKSEPRVVKILSFLYIGNIEVLFNERLLCRLGIKSIIDLSDMTPDEDPGFKKSVIPCMCAHDENHLKATLRVGIDGADLAEIESSFKQINKFIEGAKNVDKKVLVVCWTGISVSPLAVMQYLMVHQGYSLRRAYYMVMRQGSEVEISSSHQLILKTLERQLQMTERWQATPSYHSGKSPDKADKADMRKLTKEAWTTGESFT